MTDNHSYTSFSGNKRLASGSLPVVSLAVKRAIDSGTTESILTFENATGRTIGIDTWGSDEEMLARLPQPIREAAEPEPDESRGRGRPKLGVVAREVTLLPRHWEWLATQPGGASVALRKLVEEARRANSEKDRNRRSQERVYHFISAMAGNLPGFEEATRALFANNQSRFAELIATWPDDISDHALWLASDDLANN